ncbi:matrixin family metalloprotease [Synoicihabitans lomoniglobus]|uniref:matrixin family metalloprotease n=1 Tax=Synoicihabitans lomoniglobus TaxID=2909285 RepID=UPI002ED1B811|nr:matrixin family metalloprotease [Opitutaceae bacterium LMO-M01]
MALSLGSTLLGFVSNRTPWPDGNVRVELNLGVPSAPLRDGKTSFDAVAADVIALWNAEIDRTTMVAVSRSLAPVGDENGYNNVFFDSNTYGEDMGDALAITITYIDTGQFRHESDIVVNSSYTWDSYRGPLEDDTDDLHRVLLHEFGHFLGLGHPDENFQSVDAIMNSVVGDLDALQLDDTYGIAFNYNVGGSYGGVGDNDDHGGTFATATVISRNDTVSARLGSWDHDYFAVQLTTSGSLTIRSTGDIDTYGYLYGAAGELHAINDQGGDGDNFLMIGGMLTPGTYYVLVEGYSGSTLGEYTLQVSFDSDPAAGDTVGNTFASAASLGLDAETSAAIDYNFDIDYYQVVLTQAGYLHVSSTGDLDTLGGILDGDENVIAFDDESGEGSNFSFRSRLLMPGTYYIEVTGFLGTHVGSYGLTTRFEPVEGELSTAARLMNLSVRTGASGAFGPLIVGFVTEGSSKLLLVRGVGPTLAGFGVTDYMGDPRLTMYDSAQAEVDANDDWIEADDALELALLADEVGAFDLTAYLDSAIQATPSPGAYTIHVEDYDDEAGQALVEVYDADGLNVSGRLLNLSTRTQVGLEGSILTAGFVVAGEGTIRLLIRGVGPQLATFGVTDALADVRIDLFNATPSIIGSNDDWGDAQGDIAAASATVGAFALDAGSADAALLVELSAGSYTVQMKGVGDASGQGLIEVYEIPSQADLLNGNRGGNRTR